MAALAPASACAVPSREFQGASFAVPDNGGVRTKAVTVSGVGTWLWDVDVEVEIDHASASDLVIKLMSPQGTDNLASKVQ